MEVARCTFFSFPVDDRAGQVAMVMEKLRAKGIDLDGLWGFGIEQSTGQVIVVPREPQKLKSAAVELGWSLQEGVCFRITGADELGVLVDILERIAASGVNLHALDSVAVGGKFGCYIWVQESDIDKLGSLLDV